jgi:hypothetical protein
VATGVTANPQTFTTGAPMSRISIQVVQEKQ